MFLSVLIKYNYLILDKLGGVALGDLC